MQLGSTDIDTLDKAIGLVVENYNGRIGAVGTTAVETAIPEFKAADGADLSTAITRIFTKPTDKERFDPKAPDFANVLVDVFSTDEAYELDRQRELKAERELKTQLPGLKAAIYAAVKKLIAVFDDKFILASPKPAAVTDEQQNTIQAVQKIENGPAAIFGTAIDPDAQEQLYLNIRTKVPLYGRAALKKGDPGNQMPRMRDSRFRQAIKMLNEEFVKKMKTMPTPLFHGISETTLNEMVRLEASETGPLEMFGLTTPTAGTPIAPPLLADLDKSYKEKFDKVDPVRRKPEGPALNFWAKEVLKKLGSDFNAMVATTPAVLTGLAKAVDLTGSKLEQTMLDKMREIEEPDPLLFRTPPAAVDIRGNLEKAFNDAKVTTGTLTTPEQVRAALAADNLAGMVNRLDFDNELLGDEYLRLAALPKGDQEVTNENPDLTAAAKEMTPSQANTLGLTAPAPSVDDVEKAFADLYRKLGFNKPTLDITFTNFLEVRQRFVEEMAKTYVTLVQKSSEPLTAQDKKLLKDLETLFAKTSDLEILGLNAAPTKTLELDTQFAKRLMEIDREVMASNLGPLKEFSSHVLPSIKQKIANAFDRLYEASQKPGDPITPNDLRKALRTAEKDATLLLLDIAPGGAIVKRKIEEIEKQYTDFMDSKLKTLLENLEMADFNGLRRRVDHSLNSLNRVYLELLSSMEVSQAPAPAVEAAVKKAKEILDQPTQEEVLGLTSGAKPTNLDELDVAFQKRLNELNLADSEVAKLPALNTVIDELVLRALDNAYALVGKPLMSKPPLSTVLRGMENGLDDIEKLGGKKPFNKAEGLAVDKRYFDLVSKLLGFPVPDHYGLLNRAKRLLKKLNAAYDTVVTMHKDFFDPAITAAIPLHSQLKAATAKKDADLFGPQTDIKGLSKEYAKQKEVLRQAAVDPKLNVYPGLKLRARAEKERLSRAFFPAASAPTITGTGTNVQGALVEANRIIGTAKDEDILDLTPPFQLKDIDEAYLNIFKDKLNLEEDPLTSDKDLVGLNQALDIVVLTKMGKAYRNLTETTLKKINQKLDQMEMGMFNTLDLVESATNDVEALTDASKFTDKTTLRELDGFYRTRFEAIRNGRNGQLAALEGLIKRSKRAKQKMNDAYDALTKPATPPNGLKLTPQKALDLQKLIKVLEDPALSADPRPLFGFSGSLSIADIDDLEKKFIEKQKEVTPLLTDKDLASLPGLVLRAREALERLKALKDQIYEDDFFGTQEEKDAWHLVVEVENAHGNAFQIFGLTKDTLTQAALDKKKKELGNILKLTLFDDPSMQKLKDRAEAAQRAIRAAFDVLKALIPGLRPAPGPGGPGQRPPGPTPIEQRNLDMEFDNNPPIVESANQCMDTVMNCRLELCKLRGYVVAMHKNCRRTCSVCFPAGQPCVDKNRFDCPTWKAQGFCNSKVYSKGMKMRECAATCGLCPLAAGRR